LRALRPGIAFALMLAALPAPSAHAVSKPPAEATNDAGGFAPTGSLIGDVLAYVRHLRDPTVPVRSLDRLETLRAAAYDSCSNLKPRDGTAGPRYDCDDVKSNIADILWVLVRHEWQNYLQSIGPQTREAAAWHLRQAIGEYKRRARLSGETQSAMEQRLRTAMGYLQEVGRQGGDSRTEEAQREEVRQFINTIISPGSTDKLMKEIAEPIQRLSRIAHESYIRAIDAEITARQLVGIIYGTPESLTLAFDRLSESERAAIADARREIGTLLAETDDSDDLPPPLLDRYGSLRQLVFAEAVGCPGAEPAADVGSDRTAQVRKWGADNLTIEFPGNEESGPQELTLLKAEERIAALEGEEAKKVQESLRYVRGPQPFNQFLCHHRRENALQDLFQRVSNSACNANDRSGVCSEMRDVLSATADGKSYLPYYDGRNQDKSRQLHNRLAVILANEPIQTAGEGSDISARIDGLEALLGAVPNDETSNGTERSKGLEDLCKVVQILNRRIGDQFHRVFISDCAAFGGGGGRVMRLRRWLPHALVVFLSLPAPASLANDREFCAEAEPLPPCLSDPWSVESTQARLLEQFAEAARGEDFRSLAAALKNSAAYGYPDHYRGEIGGENRSPNQVFCSAEDRLLYGYVLARSGTEKLLADFDRLANGTDLTTTDELEELAIPALCEGRHKAEATDAVSALIVYVRLVLEETSRSAPPPRHDVENQVRSALQDEVGTGGQIHTEIIEKANDLYGVYEDHLDSINGNATKVDEYYADITRLDRFIRTYLETFEGYDSRAEQQRFDRARRT